MLPELKIAVRKESPKCSDLQTRLCFSQRGTQEKGAYFVQKVILNDKFSPPK